MANQMNDAHQQAMIQQLMSQPQAPAGPPEGMPQQGAPQGMPPGGEGPMPPEQAMQLLQQLGVTPDNLPMVAKAIESVMMMQQAPPPQPQQPGPPMPQ